MPRAAKRVLFLLGLFLAVVLVLDAYDSPSLSWTSREAEPAAAPEPPRHTGPPRPAAADEPPVLPGRTRFQRRLAAGSELKRLQREVEDGVRGTPALLARFQALTPALLFADGFDPRDLGDGGRHELWSVLEGLTIPARDLDGLRLAPKADDAVGTGLLVRVWTQEGDYPEGEIRDAEAMLRHLASVAGTQHEDGFDVLATPDMGRDAFPRQPSLEWAAGLYLHADRYCCLRSLLRPAFRREVLKHELVHAFTHDLAGPRLVREGLAETLRLCRPGDAGLAVPADRLADNLAALHAIHVRILESGGSLRALRPARLLELSPGEFYSLRHFAYLTAQAAVAYAGAEAVEEALRSRSPGPIAAAVRAMDWAHYLDWVARGGAGGEASRAVVVTDAGERTATAQAAFAKLGVVLPEAADSRGLEHRPFALLGSRERQRALLELLGAPGARPILLTDLSPAMDEEPFVLAADHDLLARPFSAEALQATTCRAFVERLYRALREGAGGEPPLLAGLADGVPVIEPAQLADEHAFRTDDVGPWLAGRKAQDQVLVLCVAARDLPAREAAKRLAAAERRVLSAQDLVDALASSLARGGIRIRAALVVDLARKRSDALAIAAAIALIPGFGGETAYWDPQEER